ncbi:hypothetical protein YW7DRAFT_07009 [Streptomyces sp. AmelKG-E11A]|nr:hypothetical protein YW7DRAFT_07009 [Streptomyces sp. AmelKG-E11A]
MAAKRNSRTARRIPTARFKAAAGALAALILLALLHPMIWLYIGSVLAAAGVGWMAWRLWRTDRLLRSKDATWRRQDRSQRAGGRWLSSTHCPELSSRKWSQSCAAVTAVHRYAQSEVPETTEPMYSVDCQTAGAW